MRRSDRRKRIHTRRSEKHPRLKTKPFKGLDNTKEIDRILEKGKLFHDLLGFSGEHLGHLFEGGVSLLHQHRFEEAVQAFDLLTQLNPYIADFWLGLGLAHDAQEEFTKALSAFLVAQTMDPSREDCYSCAVSCCLEMKNYPQAEAIVEEGFAYAKKHPRHEGAQTIIKEMQVLENRIKQEKNHLHKSKNKK